MNVACSIGTGRRVFDGPDYREHALALAIAENPNAIAAAGRLDSGIELAGIGGEGEAAVLIEDADALNTRLTAQFLDDVDERVAVIVQHAVAGAAEHDVRQTVRRLFDERLGVIARHAQVEVA